MLKWMPEAKTRIVPKAKGKPFIGGDPNTRLAVLHSTETSWVPNYSAPPHITAAVLQPRMLELGYVWQHVPFDLAAYALRENSLEDDWWTWQVEFIAYAGDMGTYPDHVYENIAWVCNWFVENMGVEPNFADFSVMQAGTHARQRMPDSAVRAFNGFIGHGHFGRGTDTHWDPGQLDVPRLQRFMDLEDGMDYRKIVFDHWGEAGLRELVAAGAYGSNVNADQFVAYWLSGNLPVTGPPDSLQHLVEVTLSWGAVEATKEGSNAAALVRGSTVKLT